MPDVAGVVVVPDVAGAAVVPDVAGAVAAVAGGVLAVLAAPVLAACL
ncbi:MAG: hypothetical protein M0Z76_02310 [Gammaproteobacteria bacterium]|nr:hypothetical protein [Gammaproteobacteria bacterium]